MTSENQIKWFIRTGKVFIVRHEGKIVGSHAVEIDLSGKVAHGFMIAIEPSFQSKGVSKAISYATIEYAKS